MGRHSAPDDEPEAADIDAATAVALAPVPSGRHARADDGARDAALADDSALTGLDSLLAEPVSDAAEPPLPAPPLETAALPATGAASDAVASDAPTTDSPTSDTPTSDFALLRSHGDVRARVIAGAIAPFALFTAAMAGLDRLDRSYLIWIWIPLITAGVLVGLFLDLGHRRYSR